MANKNRILNILMSYEEDWQEKEWNERRLERENA